MEPVSSRATSGSQASGLHESGSQTPVQRLLTSLRSPFATLEELEDILLQVLAALGAAVPLPFKEPPRARGELRGEDVLHVLPMIQHIVLKDVLPTWLTLLLDVGHEQLARELFCPSPTTRAAQMMHASQRSHGVTLHCKVATSSLPTLLSHLHTINPKDPGPAAILAFCVSVLGDVVSSYPMDLIHDVLFSKDKSVDSRRDGRLMQEWEDYVRSACSVPGRVANALQRQKDVVPSENLEYGAYFSNACVSAEKILHRISQITPKDAILQSHSHLLLKLLNLGMFPPTPPTLPSQPSFFSSTLPTIRRRLHLSTLTTTSSDAASAQYSKTWTAAFRALPLTSQHTFIVSLFGALECQVGRDTSAVSRGKVGEAAGVLRGVLGKPGESGAEDEGIWSTASAAICSSGRTWDVGVARAVVCWVADPQDSGVDEAALEILLDATIALWTNPESVRHSLLSQDRYTSSLLLLLVASFPDQSPALSRLAVSPPFIASISTYLSHLDAEVRRCGMLVAEVVAARCGKRLEFGGWEGASEGLEWARCMRGWTCDWVAEGFRSGSDVEATADKGDEDTTPPLVTSPPSASSPAPTPAPDSDDDSLRGYDSPVSSRSASPTPSELAEIEKDPTLRVGRPKPIARPVYLAQVVALLRAAGGGTTDDEGVPEKMEVVLMYTEGLVRRKKGFGLELDENAVELTIALTGLKDAYELEGFEEKRQGALNALVECCPRKAAMTLIEQFFTNQYSMGQRSVMLTALAIGARALAGLPIPPPSSKIDMEGKNMNMAFPSRMLPPALHRRYATVEERNTVQGGAGGGEVQRLVRGITGDVMERSKGEVEKAIPEVVRERKLRLGSARKGVAEVMENETWTHAREREHRMPKGTTFAEVAAEYFVMPLVNHMWLHLRDVETRSGRGRGVGTGIILGPVVVAQYLGTLAVLVHAARHAPAFLGVVVPGAVEMCMALGRRGIDDGEGDGDGDGAVVTAALEVALVALDGAVDLDGGRTLGLEYTGLVLGLGEWAGGILDGLEGGRRVRGGGGAVEGRMGGAAAGVVLKVESVISRWNRSMVGL